MKKIIIMILVLFGVVLLSACTIDEPIVEDKKDNQQQEEVDELLELTIEELSMYNGDNGNPSYIAANGIIYDITNVSAWSDGNHNGGVAGTDISNLIDEAPHGESVLDDLDVVGEVVE